MSRKGKRAYSIKQKVEGKKQRRIGEKAKRLESKAQRLKNKAICYSKFEINLPAL